MKIEIDAKARNEEKLWDIAEYLEALKSAVVEIESDYEDENGISDVLTDALEYLDDAIDAVNEAAEKFKEADGLIVVSPVYYGSPNGTLISFLDRLFYSRYYPIAMKVGAAFAIARRGGTVASFDVLNKYFTISGMPVASGDYWNNGFGREKGEIEQDKEGLRNARVVAKRMVFLMKAIKDAKENYPDMLEDEPRVFTHFIH